MCFRQFLILISLTFIAPAIFAQITPADLKLAEQYYNNEDFEKAEVYYEVIAKEKPDKKNFTTYLDILTKLEKFKEARKLVSKRMKTYPDLLGLHLDMAKLYEMEGEEAKADQECKKAISKVGKNSSQVKNLAQAFVKANMMEQALETYKQGKDVLGAKYPFNYEMATLYGQMGDMDRMINEYLELIGFNEAYMKTVQNALSRSIDFESDDENIAILKTGLLTKIQEQPQKEIYYNFLIWLFTQKKDFNSAYIQTKAIDMRNSGNGSRLIKLADLCTNNESYDLAEKCYQYVIEKGRAGRYYETSKMMALTSSLKALKKNYLASEEESMALDLRYSETLTELGKNAGTGKLLREQAEVRFKYLHDTQGAMDLLDEAIKTPGVKKNFQAYCKLDLADMLLSAGYIWDASLYFSQVEKDFKNDILGAEAKYRNAKISFYVGDFEWAQAQLDVLKASTSKLISNDAIDLSLLITDNLNLDTILDPMQLYARADLLRFQNKHEESLQTLDSIVTQYPGHSLEDEILYTKYEIEKSRGNFEIAAKYLNDIMIEYSDDILVDNAIFELAEMKEVIFNLPDEAQELYKKLILEYPGSLFGVEARKRFRNLRGDDIN
ncbi:MAG: tetratricopeptide (TPR) repeat protein [Patiriisocius sp.]|jgi:tetratricopeptide (TPR) repeat protein